MRDLQSSLMGASGTVAPTTIARRAQTSLIGEGNWPEIEVVTTTQQLFFSLKDGLSCVFGAMKIPRPLPGKLQKLSADHWPDIRARPRDGLLVLVVRGVPIFSHDVSDKCLNINCPRRRPCSAFCIGEARGR